MNDEFWNAVDELVRHAQIIIDRPKGTPHPRYPDFIYPVDYGYLKGTASMDGEGIDVWAGTGEKRVSGIICTVDLLKKDSELRTCIHNLKRCLARVFFRWASLNFLEIHPVCLRKFALPNEKIPRPSSIFGCEYRFLKSWSDAPEKKPRPFTRPRTGRNS